MRHAQDGSTRDPRTPLRFQLTPNRAQRRLQSRKIGNICLVRYRENAAMMIPSGSSSVRRNPGLVERRSGCCLGEISTHDFLRRSALFNAPLRKLTIESDAELMRRESMPAVTDGR
jgi:hypothetical protein